MRRLCLAPWGEAMRGCIPYTELPGCTKLLADFAYAFGRVARFYAYDPWEPNAVQMRLDRLAFGSSKRSRLVEVLREQNGDCEALSRLAKPDGVAVVTGQQVGLLGGAALTFYKALTAIQLAERLTQRGIPAAAVFWLASEDHDYEEVNHCWVFDADGMPVRLAAERGAHGDRRPVGTMPVPEEIVGQFRAVVAEMPHGPAVVQLVSRCYAPGRSFAGAFAMLMREVLGRDRLLTFDPLDWRVRDLLAEPLAIAAERIPEIVAALDARSGELLKLGYELQVRTDRGASLLFLLEGGERIAVRREPDGWSVRGARMPATALAARARDLSAGALLRPVVQDWVFPTVVSVVGPAEVAYLAQASALYDCLGLEKPVWRLRASCTLLNRRAARLFARYSLKLHEFYGGEQAFYELLAARMLPPGVSLAVESCAGEVRAALDRMEREVALAGGALPRWLAKSRRKIEYQLAKIVRGVARETLRRNEAASRHARWLFQQVFPNRSLQERVYSILPYLAREGLELTRRLAEAISPDCRGHQLIEI